MLLAILVPSLLLLMVPFWLVGEHLASDPAARAILAERPLIGVQLLVGLIVLVGIFGWPLAHLARRSLEWRRITIDGKLVRSDAVGLFGRSSWAEPLAHYAGVTHRVRTSLSGVSHEMVLVHRQPSRSVILQSGAPIPLETLTATARHFDIAEIPTREAASFTPLHGYFRLAEPQPQLAPG